MNVSAIGLDVGREVDQALSVVLDENVDALMVGSSAIAFANARRFVAVAAENKLPAMHATREAVEAGGLMSYSTSVPNIFRQMARLTDQILRGSKPADLPVAQSAKFELVINARTAAGLGLKPSSWLLAATDEILNGDMKGRRRTGVHATRPPRERRGLGIGPISFIRSRMGARLSASGEGLSHPGLVAVWFGQAA